MIAAAESILYLILDHFFFPAGMPAEFLLIFCFLMVFVFLISVFCISKYHVRIHRHIIAKTQINHSVFEWTATIFYMVLFFVWFTFTSSVLSYYTDFVNTHLSDCMDTRVFVKYNNEEIIRPAQECRYRTTASGEWGEWKLTRVY